MTKFAKAVKDLVDIQKCLMCNHDLSQHRLTNDKNVLYVVCFNEDKNCGCDGGINQKLKLFITMEYA